MRRKIAVGGVSGLPRTPPALPDAVRSGSPSQVVSLQPEVMTSLGLRTLSRQGLRKEPAGGAPEMLGAAFSEVL